LCKKEMSGTSVKPKKGTWRHIAASRVFRMQVRYSRNVLACEKRKTSVPPDDASVKHTPKRSESSKIGQVKNFLQLFEAQGRRWPPIRDQEPAN
jgi:hypothetical protein